MKFGDLIDNLNEAGWEKKLEKPIAEYTAKELMKMAKAESKPKYTIELLFGSVYWSGNIEVGTGRAENILG